MFKKGLALILIMMLLAIAAVGCGGGTAVTQPESTESTESTETKTETTNEQASESVSAVSYPLTITDDSGAQVTIEKKPERIVSILPSTTEVAFALGLGDLVVGVSDHDNYPEEASTKEKIGGFELNYEKIVSLNPDVVLAGAEITAPAVAKLRELGLTVVAVEPKSIEAVYTSIELIAQVTDSLDKGTEVIDQMKSEYDQVVQALSGVSEDAKPKVWIELDETLYTTGKGTFMDHLITIAGGINIAGSEEGWPQFAPEKVIESNPNVILVNYNYVENAVDKVKAREGWDTIGAVQDDRVFQLDQDLVSRPGPRVTQGLLQIAQFLYPDKF
jgi:iron complex transport system substrate-binding protein